MNRSSRREQGDLRLDAEALHFRRRQQRDLGDLLGARILVHMRVADEQRTARQQQVVHRGHRLHARRLADDFLDLAQMVAKAPGDAGDHAVGVTQLEQHGADDRVVLTQAHLGDLDGDAVALHQRVIRRPALLVAIVAVGIDDLEMLAGLQLRADLRQAHLDHVRATDQDRLGDALFQRDLDRAQHALVLAVGIDDALRRALLRRREHGAHADAGVVDEFASFSL